MVNENLKPIIKNDKPRKRKKRKEIFKFHFWASFLIIMPINVLLIIFVERWRYYFLFWEYATLLWLAGPLFFCLIYAFCRTAGVRAVGVRWRFPIKQK
ncbi:hypothetical protein [endosymbiont DhMRE of Dentiscutata heterogama]|uniref:hypothetical protein n=1 Tax=endosymbiont DhMRE of Dentiscutata heterogama TaxID=1609546 RepID=UPI002AD56084|nr:hypothetical protein [endosymbiont DhMRE of Dentiscutata heterogama]